MRTDESKSKSGPGIVGGMPRLINNVAKIQRGARAPREGTVGGG
jgi:hypothetical protein